MEKFIANLVKDFDTGEGVDRRLANLSKPSRSPPPSMRPGMPPTPSPPAVSMCWASTTSLTAARTT